MYPESDNEYYEQTITRVKPYTSDGLPDRWEIGLDDGFCFIVWEKDCSFSAPEVGMTARFYGTKFGVVRGLFLDGKKAYYRTKEEDHLFRLKEVYGETVAEYLERWEKGDAVWSISMGGFGPGYEQALQIAMIEMLKFLQRNQVPLDNYALTVASKEMDRYTNPTLEKLGLSGAQWGAAKNLALRLWRNGPIGVMTDEQVKDRRIQIQRHFPTV